MNSDSAGQHHAAPDIFGRLAELLEPRSFHAGILQQVGDKNVSLTIFPDDGQGARDHTVVIRCPSVPSSETAGAQIQLVASHSASVICRGWLDRRGTARLANVPLGEYRLVVSPRPREQVLEPARIAQSETDLITHRPIEFSLGRFYAYARQSCLILLWEPMRPGAGGSARIIYDRDSTQIGGDLLIPGDPNFWIAPWRQRGKDLRVCLEATGEGLVVPANGPDGGFDYIAVGRFVYDRPTLIERLNDLERRVAARSVSMPLGALPLGSAGHVISLAASSGPVASSSSEAKLDDYITFLRNGAAVKFNYPEHLVPYGVIRVEIYPKATTSSESGTQPARILLPMKSTHGMRTNSIPFNQLTTAHGPRDVDIIPVSPGNPALTERENKELLLSFDPVDVEQLLEDPYVATRPELAADLRRLVTDIRRARLGSGGNETHDTVNKP